MLFHGKNFCAATWRDTIAALVQAGYRAIAVDQIGFCKSTKPAHYQFTFQQLAGNTHALLASLGITRPTIIGHSVGGMLGMRYALTFPDDVDQLVLVDPIGLEDWKAKGVPWQSVDAWYHRSWQRPPTAFALITRDLLRRNLGCEVRALGANACGPLSRPGHDIVAWNAALVDDMAYTQPVFYELERITVPVLLIVGDKDTTAIGKNLAPPAIRATLGNYPVLAKAAVAGFREAI